MKDHFQETLQQHKDTTIDAATQELLNRPLEKILDTDIEQYKRQIIELLGNNTINPFLPMSLVRDEVYSHLTEQEQARVDLVCVNLCGILRQIQTLRKQQQDASHQMELLIRSIFLAKERLESDLGDVLFL